jgi:hypothetical protein
MNILHDKPIRSLFVFSVDSGCFDEFGFEANDRLGVLVAVEVDCQGVHSGICLTG